VISFGTQSAVWLFSTNLLLYTFAFEHGAALEAGQEVIVMIKRSGSLELRFLHKNCWVPIAGTLCTLLVTFVAW
jgi:hypothetical protein